MAVTLKFYLGMLFCMCLAGHASTVSAQHEHHHHNMQLDRDGMVMNSNEDELPKDCEKISVEISIIVEVGKAYAQPGFAFGYDNHEYRIPPCARISVTLVNKDNVRHQWMVHGLPRYLYPQGMFHLEVSGLRSKTGKFIVPSDEETYLIHCDISHHMEKGLKAQLIVGRGNGDLPSVPTISANRRADRY